MLVGLLALFALAFKVSGLIQLTQAQHYTVTAEFDDIGSLKPRAPIRIAGVRIGKVHSIHLDPFTYKAMVTFFIDKQNDKLPADSSAKIMTEGLLGANYISITPGFEDLVLHDGDRLDNTHSALILENIMGQLLFSLKEKPKQQVTLTGEKANES